MLGVLNETKLRVRSSSVLNLEREVTGPEFIEVGELALARRFVIFPPFEERRDDCFLLNPCHNLLILFLNIGREEHLFHSCSDRKGRESRNRSAKNRKNFLQRCGCR